MDGVRLLLTGEPTGKGAEQECPALLLSRTNIPVRPANSASSRQTPAARIAADRIKRAARKCERGGIGRRAGFRFQYRKVWGFESPRSHQPRGRLVAGNQFSTAHEIPGKERPTSYPVLLFWPLFALSGGRQSRGPTDACLSPISCHQSREGQGPPLLRHAGAGSNDHSEQTAALAVSELKQPTLECPLGEDRTGEKISQIVEHSTSLSRSRPTAQAYHEPDPNGPGTITSPVHRAAIVVLGCATALPGGVRCARAALTRRR